MFWFKSDILATFQFCQNGTFEPVHKIQKQNFGQKTTFEASRKCLILKIYVGMYIVVVLTLGQCIALLRR